MENALKIVVAGAVDSGKSTLIGRLLYETGSLHRGAMEEIKELCRSLGRNFEFAYLLDSFEEERKGELTIDTTQATCKVKDGKEFIFIDVPGHREFIKNMLSGATYADAAILVVDISKQIEEQTRIHALILKFLGIKKVILALNKIDANNFSEYAFIEAKENIANFFHQIELEPEYYIPISAREGCNLLKRCEKTPWHRGLSLFDVLNSTGNEPVGNDFRFSVQDIYNIEDRKIAVGPIVSGKVVRREAVNILPLNRKSKVKAIKSFTKNKSVAEYPENVGLILEDMDNLSRGFIISDSDTPDIVRELRARIFCLAELNINKTVKIKCLNQAVTARINQLKRVCGANSPGYSQQETPLNDSRFLDAVIITDEPLVIEPFTSSNSLGRFIIEENDEIRAVGIVC